MATDPRLRSFAVYSRLGGLKAATLVEPDGRRTPVIFVHGRALPVNVFLACLLARLAGTTTNPWPEVDEAARRVWYLVGDEPPGPGATPFVTAAQQEVDAILDAVVADLRGPDARASLCAYLATVEAELASGEGTLIQVG